jgi:hypothetical protein
LKPQVRHQLTWGCCFSPAPGRFSRAASDTRRGQGEREGSAFGQAKDIELLPGSARCARWKFGLGLPAQWSGDSARRSRPVVGLGPERGRLSCGAVSRPRRLVASRQQAARTLMRCRKAIVARTSAVLLIRGVEVEPVAVRDVVALMVRSLAERMNMDPKEALHLVRPESVAEAITTAADSGHEGAEHVYAVRPVRVDASTIAVPVRTPGRLVMAAAQAGSEHCRLGDRASALGGTACRSGRRPLSTLGAAHYNDEDVEDGTQRAVHKTEIGRTSR